jgi:integrase
VLNLNGPRGAVERCRSPRWSPTPSHSASRQSRPPADGTLFTTRTAAPYRHDYYGSMIFAAAVKKAKLPTETTSHDLRHHYASVLLAAGESVVAVAERLGHENASLVLSPYGHLMPDSEDRTRRAVDEAWSAITVPSDQLATP